MFMYVGINTQYDEMMFVNSPQFNYSRCGKMNHKMIPSNQSYGERNSRLTIKKV